MLESNITNAIENPKWQGQNEAMYRRTLDRVHDILEEAMKKRDRKYNWYTIQGASEYCNCSKVTLHRAIKRGDLKTTKPSGLNKLMFRRDWLDRWMNG